MQFQKFTPATPADLRRRKNPIPTGRPQPGLLVDPSAGDGIFLGHALERLLDHYPEIPPHDIPSYIQGWEIHPHAAEAAQKRLSDILDYCVPDLSTRTALVRQILLHKDFLTEGPNTPTFDLIAGNPPYLIWRRIPELLQNDYASLVPRHAQGDLLHSFLDRSMRCLKPNGIIALVTSDRWLFNTNAAKLRETLGEADLSLAHLTKLDPKTSFYRPKNRRANTPPRIHPVSVILGHLPDNPAPLTKAPIYPGADSLGPLPTTTLSDIAEISLAPWLGTPGIFVLDERHQPNFPASQIVPAVDTDDIQDGKLMQPKRFALLTRPNEEPPHAILRHLQQTLHRMAERGKQTPYWVPPERFHNMDLSQPRLLIPRIAKTLKAVHLPPGILAINHNLTIVKSSKVPLDRIATALTSDLAQKWIGVIAPRLENGYHSITPAILRSLPVEL